MNFYLLYKRSASPLPLCTDLFEVSLQQSMRRLHRKCYHQKCSILYLLVLGWGSQSLAGSASKGFINPHITMRLAMLLLWKLQYVHYSIVAKFTLYRRFQFIPGTSAAAARHLWTFPYISDILPSMYRKILHYVYSALYKRELELAASNQPQVPSPPLLMTFTGLLTQQQDVWCRTAMVECKYIYGDGQHRVEDTDTQGPRLLPPKSSVRI